MTRIIRQSITLNASPQELFRTFLDSKRHSALTGAPAKIGPKAGGRFTAFGGALRGRNLLIVPDSLIVQSWRSSGWKAGDADSVLVLQFSKAPDGGRIDLLHVNVPSHDRKGVTNGWRKYYWTPWKAQLLKK